MNVVKGLARVLFENYDKYKYAHGNQSKIEHQWAVCRRVICASSECCSVEWLKPRPVYTVFVFDRLQNKSLFAHIFMYILK